MNVDRNSTFKLNQHSATELSFANGPVIDANTSEVQPRFQGGVLNPRRMMPGLVNTARFTAKHAPDSPPSVKPIAH